MRSEIESLENEVLLCTKCGLAATRNHVIFGEGNIAADILIIGETPGRDEDLQGRPFVGKSGQLLDKILALLFTVYKETIKYLKESGIKHILPSHCTDFPALTAFYENFGFKQIRTGDILTF